MRVAAAQPPALDDRQFELAVRKLADALQYGADASPFLGGGVDYAQSRPYQSGDAVRSMDWRVTARSGKPFVKQYEAPKQMATWLAVDDSGSMGVSSLRRGGVSKWRWACLLAGALGLAALRRSSPVGLLLAGGDRHPPSLSRGRLYGWLHGFRRREPVGAASLGEMLRRATPTMTSRANLIVLSDLHDPALLAALKLAAEPHDVTVLRLRDPAEDAVRGGGVFRGTEAETGASFVATGRTRFNAGEAAEALLTRAGIDRLTLDTDGQWLAGLREFLRRRGATGGRR